jgi:hypothetical protein
LIFFVDDLFSAPSVRTSRPATGGRRGAVRGFSPESAQDSPSDATPVLTQSVAPETLPPKNVTTASTKKITDDWDDGDLDIDIDSLLTDSDKPKARVLPNDSFGGNKPQPKIHEPLDDSVDNLSLPGTKQHFTRPNSAPAAQEREIEPIITQEEHQKVVDVMPARHSKNSDAAADEVDLGFVPSFLESGRETRTRRFSSFP